MRMKGAATAYARPRAYSEGEEGSSEDSGEDGVGGNSKDDYYININNTNVNHRANKAG
jgi:hypothetical protein